MRSPPSSFHADYKSNKQRVKKPSSVHTSKSPRLGHRAVRGRITRPRSATPLPLSTRNQQIFWETITRRTWEAEQVEPPPEAVQSLQYIAPQSLAVSPVQSAAPPSPAISLEGIAAAITPVDTAAEQVDTQNLLRYGDNFFRNFEWCSQYVSARWNL
jgi:hypothetical protein